MGVTTFSLKDGDWVKLRQMLQHFKRLTDLTTGPAGASGSDGINGINGADGAVDGSSPLSQN